MTISLVLSINCCKETWIPETTLHQARPLVTPRHPSPPLATPRRASKPGRRRGYPFIYLRLPSPMFHVKHGGSHSSYINVQTTG